MSDLSGYLHAYATQNRFGVGFLLAYALTWLLCGALWLRLPEKRSALLTLFQSAVALPLAFGFTALLGRGAPQVETNTMISSLSAYIATGQVMGFPLLIYFVVTEQARLVPYIFATIIALHFSLYAWFYQTPAYTVLSVLLSLGGFVVMRLGVRGRLKNAPAVVCFFTGTVMALTGTWLLLS